MLDSTVLLRSRACCSRQRRTWCAAGAARCGAAVAPPPALPATSTPAEVVASAAASLAPVFAAVDGVTQANVRRVLTAFRSARVGSHMFAGSSGYGHEDEGRLALDSLFAQLVGAESALVRSQFFSGTHTIACALFGALRPGDELLALAGKPYDTLEEVIGSRGRPGDGSLKEMGVSYREQPLAADGGLDWDALRAGVLRHNTKVVLIQRSRGYSTRPTLSVAVIGQAIQLLKRERPDIIVAVDNCYGEFTEAREPSAVGADLMMGSLIKNPGGTIVPCGGYIAGRADLVDNAASRLCAPGVGRDAGATPGDWRRLLFQGLFLAPQMVGEAVKSSHLIATVLGSEGFECAPRPGEARSDIITSITLRSPARQLAFCAALQKACPVGAYIRPEAAATPGYASQVVFANGTFIEGSTAELSADGPLRPPYVVYCQGGTHVAHWAIALEEAVAALRDAAGAGDAPDWRNA